MSKFTALFSLLLFFAKNVFAQDIIWTDCITAAKYIYIEGGKDPKDVKKPIVFCYNKAAFGFKREQTIQLLWVSDYETRILDNGIMQEEFTCKNDNINERGDFIVWITHSNPGKIQIIYTRFGGYNITFFSKEIPVITERVRMPPDSNKKLTASISKPQQNNRIKYPINNKQLNNGISFVFSYDGSSHPWEEHPDWEPICAVDIKKFVKSKLPYVDRKFGEITLMITIDPSGKVLDAGAGISPDISQTLAKKFFKDIDRIMRTMPQWRVPPSPATEIQANINITY